MSAVHWRLFVFGVLAITALTAAMTSFRYTVAEAYSFLGKKYERHWESRGKVSSEQEWQQAQSHMRSAFAWNIENPDGWLRAARMHEWYAFTPSPNPELLAASLVSASTAVDAGLALRPDDGYGLSQRAMLKVRRGAVDAALSSDMVAAQRLAPWEATVQRRLAYAGVAAWSELDSVGRQVLLKGLSAAAIHQPHMAEEMLEIADHFGRLGLLCSALSAQEFQSMQAAGLMSCRAVD